MTTFRVVLFMAFSTTLWGQGSDQGFGSSLAGKGALDIGRAGAEALRPRWFGILSAIYDPTLTLFGTGPEGRPLTSSTEGVQVTFGFYGRKDLKRSTFGWRYDGDYSKYTEKTQLDGQVHRVGLGYSNRVSRKTIFSFQAGAGTSNRASGIATATDLALADTEALGIPVAELFDTRYNFINGVGTLKYIQSSRLNYEIGGSAFIVERSTKALAGVKSYSGLSRASYRLKRDTWLSAGYTFMHYEYPRAFGASDMHQGYARFEKKFAKVWDFAVQGGVYRVESLGLQRVTIDPVIAAIIGRSSGVEAFYRIDYVDSETVSVSRSFRRSSINVSLARGLSPGNGLLLTSRSTTLGGRYSTTSGRWSYSSNMLYANYGSLTVTLPAYNGYSLGAGANRSLGRNLHFTSRVDYRIFNLGPVDLARRNGARISVGIGYSPGETPLSTF